MPRRLQPIHTQTTICDDISNNKFVVIICSLLPLLLEHRLLC